MKSNLRQSAAKILEAVVAGESLTNALKQSLDPKLSARDKAWIQSVCFGVCRYYHQLSFILKQLMQKPLKAKDLDIQLLLMVGLYQIKFMRVLEHAAVSETVQAAKAVKPKMSALVNGVLREYIRQQPRIEQAINQNEVAKYSHPQWLLELLKHNWPDQYQEILEANNALPPLAIRVNSKRCSREAYLQKLQAAGIEAVPIANTNHGVIISKPLAVTELPGFLEGEVTVQDGAAQLCAELLELSSAARVLDACAAPGGKLTHILETTTNVVAVEKDTHRISQIKENLVRLQQTATVINADILELSKWWDGNPFDRILLDAPCSATGVIRRHPDIKLLRKPKDIAEVAQLQQHMLEALWSVLKPGGKLLYVTCSVMRTENDSVIKEFIAKHSDAQLCALPEIGLSQDFGLQILPGMNNMDGFFYAKLQKQR